jgi:outer membrane protein OmpA-like peptidoglycan-associated protein
MKTFKLLLLGLVVMTVAFASFSLASADDYDATKDSRLWFFGGADFGYNHLTTTQPGETNLDGTQVDIKALLSLYTEKFVLDGGGGWLFNNLSGNEQNGNVNINSRSAFAELDARYRFNNYWQFGPAADVSIDSDFSLTPVPTNNKNTAVFVGGQLDYEVNPESPNSRVRIIARVMNTVGLENSHSLLIAQLGFQIGLPFTKAAPAVEPAPAFAEPAPATTPVVESSEVKPVVQIVLGHEFIHFDTASAKLSKKSEKFLKAVGKMLAERNDAWGLLEVAGHTDSRGKHALNLKLSRNRAISVRKALIAGGADVNKIRSEGYSFDKPIDPSHNAKAWAKNRRVELNFLQASDPQAIKDGMDEVKRKF